jgi:hypothetical protein
MTRIYSDHEQPLSNSRAMKLRTFQAISTIALTIFAISIFGNLPCRLVVTTKARDTDSKAI